MKPLFVIGNVGVGLLLFSLIWMNYTSFERSNAISEIEKVKNEFLFCDRKILNAIEESSFGECKFSVEKGMLTLQDDIIDYQIVETDICEPKDWTNLNGRIRERCIKKGSLTLYEIRWESPNIIFQKYGIRGNTVKFRKLSEININNAKGYLLSISIL